MSDILAAAPFWDDITSARADALADSVIDDLSQVSDEALNYLRIAVLIEQADRVSVADKMRRVMSGPSPF